MDRPTMSSHDEELNVDFEYLAMVDADFAAVYKQGEGRIDYQDPQHQRQLTKSTLKQYFGLQIDLPSDRLCPPVPIRYEYIRWMQALLDTTSGGYLDKYHCEREVIGVDIGVGASCIYPLLGCASRPNWRFACTEVDDKSLEFAETNIRLNNYENRILVRQNTPEKPIMALDLLGLERADFCMCNPPFFGSKEEQEKGRTSKDKPPLAVCTGAEVEMICPGGEAAFVSRMFEESRVLGTRIQWYSSMFSSFANANLFTTKLKKEQIGNWACTSLIPGNATRRWVVAWSFGELRPRIDVAHGTGVSLLDISPPSTQLQEYNLSTNGRVVAGALDSILDSVGIEWKWVEDNICLVFAKKNVWSRAARRQKARVKQNTIGKVGDQDTVALVVQITIIQGTGEVTIRWLRGSDFVLLESFWGMLRRKLRDMCPGNYSVLAQGSEQKSPSALLKTFM